jgi:hypothetical protein
MALNRFESRHEKERKGRNQKKGKRKEKKRKEKKRKELSTLFLCFYVHTRADISIPLTHLLYF